MPCRASINSARDALNKSLWARASRNIGPDVRRGNQPTFADLVTRARSESLLERMDGLIPWEELEEPSDRSIPILAEVGVPTSCRRCFAYTACSCSNLSDPGIMLYEVESVRRFVGHRGDCLGRSPDETTILSATSATRGWRHEPWYRAPRSRRSTPSGVHLRRGR